MLNPPRLLPYRDRYNINLGFSMWLPTREAVEINLAMTYNNEVRLIAKQLTSSLVAATISNAQTLLD